MTRDEAHPYLMQMIYGLSSVAEHSERLLRDIGLGWPDECDDLFARLEDYVSACARVVRYVVPQGGQHPKTVRARVRARSLQALLDLEVERLTQVMSLRNRIAHADEDLDQLVGRQADLGCWGRAICSHPDELGEIRVSAVEGEPGLPLYLLTAFFTDEGMFLMAGRGCSVFDLSGEMMLVTEKLGEVLKHAPGFDQGIGGRRLRDAAQSLRRFAAEFPAAVRDRFAAQGHITVAG